MCNRVEGVDGSGSEEAYGEIECDFGIDLVGLDLGEETRLLIAGEFVGESGGMND